MARSWQKQGRLNYLILKPKHNNLSFIQMFLCFGFTYPKLLEHNPERPNKQKLNLLKIRTEPGYEMKAENKQTGHFSPLRTKSSH